MTPRSPDLPNGSDELAELLAEGLHRDLIAPVDTVDLLHGARHSATRLRRRRTATGAAAAVLMVAALPFGVARLADLAGLDGPTTPQSAELTTGPQLTPPVDGRSFSALEYQGDLPGLIDGGLVDRAPTVGVPTEALVTPLDMSAQGLMPRVGKPTVSQRAWDTADQACTSQPGGRQWDLGTLVREYDQQSGGQRPGWELKAVARALTVVGAKNQLRWLQTNLETCDSTVQHRWTSASAVSVGDSAVLAVAQDNDSAIAVGVVRVGAATAGFWLRVPASAGSPATRQEIARSNGRTLLQAAGRRLQDTRLSERAVATLDAAVRGPGPGPPGVSGPGGTPSVDPAPTTPPSATSG